VPSSESDPEFDRAFNSQTTLGWIAGLPAVAGLLVLLFTDLVTVGWVLIGLGVVATIGIILRAVPWFRSSNPRFRKLALFTLWEVAFLAIVIVFALLAPRD
jgi:hypothetical protein